MTKAERLLKKKKKFEDRAERIQGRIEYRKYQWKDTLQFSGSESKNEPHVYLAAGRDWKDGSLRLDLRIDDKTIVYGTDKIRELRDWLTEMLSDSLTSEMREIKGKNKG